MICHVYVVYIQYIYWLEYFDIPTKIFWYAMHMLHMFNGYAYHILCICLVYDIYIHCISYVYVCQWQNRHTRSIYSIQYILHKNWSFLCFTWLGSNARHMGICLRSTVYIYMVYTKNIQYIYYAYGIYITWFFLFSIFEKFWIFFRFRVFVALIAHQHSQFASA